ncbi:MAG: pilus assembly protein HicB [Tannerella sp.]|jgi:hypothetical protein|nr:pilus assembly protein HicB [Tannerella sp.]
MKHVLLEQKLKISITITKNGSEGYVCACDYPFRHFDLGGSGSTVEDAKKDCFTFYDEMKEEFPDENYPELDVRWMFDFPSFFNHFDFLNVTKVAKYAGMSPSNFRHYVAGSKIMSQKQFLKVKHAFDRMSDELKACTLTM